MAKMSVNEQRCKGCGLCATVCPVHIIKLDDEKLNKKGYPVAVCIDLDKCIGCARCAIICPDCVITLEDK